MYDGWMAGAAVSRLLISGSEISFLQISPRLFHMRAPAPCPLHPRSRGRPSRQALTFNRENVREKEYIETTKKKTCHPLFHLHSAKDVSVSARKYSKLGLHGEAQGWLNVSRSEAWGKTWEVKTGKDKRLSFPLLKRSNTTYRGHERDDETEQWKEMWRHSGTKGKQTELMWMLVPICKVSDSPENFPATPTFTYQLSLEPCLSSDTLIMLHAVTFEVALHCWIFFISIARGTSQATRTWRMGQERGAWEGDSFIFKITQTLYLKQS